MRKVSILSYDLKIYFLDNLNVDIFSENLNEIRDKTINSIILYLYV